MQYDYEMFKKDVYTLTNINLSLYKEKQMKRRIESLMRRYGYEDFEGFLKGLKKDTQLFDAFINHLTINVSEFYRNPGQWEYFEREILPYLIQRYGKHMKIWSAACSTGDEPYTIAMIMAKHLPLGSFQIYATDIDEAVLKKAQLGIYARRSMTGLPEDFLNHHFHKINQGDFLQISDEIKSCVEFKKHNLLEDEYPKDCHMIVCRNVVIYFTEEAKDMVYQGFHRSLVEDGILFIGSTEQIIDARELGFTSFKSFFYQKIPVGSDETATISKFKKETADKSLFLDSKREIMHTAAPVAERGELRRPASAERHELRRPAPTAAERHEVGHSASTTAERREVGHPASSVAERHEVGHPASPAIERREVRRSVSPAAERREVKHPAATAAERREMKHPAATATERRGVKHTVPTAAERREVRHPASSVAERHEVRHPASSVAERHEVGHPASPAIERREVRRSVSPAAERREVKHPAATAAERREMKHPAATATERRGVKHTVPTAAEERRVTRPASTTTEGRGITRPASTAEGRGVRRPASPTAEGRGVRHSAATATEKHEVKKPTLTVAERHEVKKPTLTVTEKHEAGKSASTEADKKNIGKSGLGTGQKKIF